MKRMLVLACLSFAFADCASAMTREAQRLVDLVKSAHSMDEICADKNKTGKFIKQAAKEIHNKDPKFFDGPPQPYVKEAGQYFAATGCAKKN